MERRAAPTVEAARFGVGRSTFDVRRCLPPGSGEPGNLHGRQQVATSRVGAARSALADCRLCLHHCGVDRLAGPAGRCHAGSNARCFSVQCEVGDELELLPTFAIALSGCNLRCDFCITGASSWNARAGTALDADGLAAAARQALAGGAQSVMILGGEPTVHMPALLALVAALPDDARLVLKTNGCFSPTAHPLLAGLFDVWLPDFKFGNDACARRLAGLDGYWATLTSSLGWLAGGEAGGHLWVRHLLMPGHVDCCWLPIARWLADSLPTTPVSLRTGYWPGWHARRHPELSRLPTRMETDRAFGIARDFRLELIP